MSFLSIFCLLPLLQIFYIFGGFGYFCYFCFPFLSPLLCCSLCNEQDGQRASKGHEALSAPHQGLHLFAMAPGTIPMARTVACTPQFHHRCPDEAMRNSILYPTSSLVDDDEEHKQKGEECRMRPGQGVMTARGL